VTSFVRLRLADLSPARQSEIMAAIAAVETADYPVSGAAFRALQDPTLREVLTGCLSESGRVLLRLRGGYLSGYDDDVGQRLAHDGIGVLAPDDRAVMALVLLHCVAIPRSAGRVAGESWLDAEPTSYAELNKSQLPNNRIQASVRRMMHAGLLRYGARKQILPGPQFARLTRRTSDLLWEDLILLAAPGGVMAQVIRSRRTARLEAAAAAAPTSSVTSTTSTSTTTATTPASIEESP
jgi:hypothetical protein